jgi:glycosyltransferase involved in cell wall biosynthesis
MQPSNYAEDPTIADLTLFELWSGGHYPNYLRLILESWRDHGTGRLRAIVTNRFLDQHRFVFEGFENTPSSPVRWVTLDEADEAALYAARAYAEGIGKKPPEGTGTRTDGILTLFWALVEKYSRRFPSRHILLMNLDEYLLALSAGRRAPADFSGIFFRPNYYYRSENADASFKQPILNTLQERLVLRLLNHPQLRIAFFIDPCVADSLKGRGSAQVIYLKDPVRLPVPQPKAERAATKSRLGVPADRKLFLLFGDITSRKGVWKIIDSLGKLTHEETARICLAIVGHAEAIVEQPLAQRLKAASASTPLMIIRRAAYVDERELGDWFTAADVVLAPYVRHVGMSGILLLAAAYRKPVISQDFGAMGRVTLEYRLGLTADPTNPTDLVRAMRRFLDETPPPDFDPELAYAFAREQSHEQFGETLLGALKPFIC